MKFIKQRETLNVKNFDINSDNSNKNKWKHSILLPNSIRSIIVGPSNCGKTNVMISLIHHPNGLKFENIYIYSKSLFQPKYDQLKKIIAPIKGMGYYTFSENNDVQPIEEAKNNSVFIFDDVACEKQNNMRSYFCMGRHKNIDSFYLCQTYTHIPKHLIRDNANLIVLFKQDDLNLKHIYTDHVNTDMSFEQFKNMCAECWREVYGFLVVNKDCPIDNGRYRKGFDIFIKI